MGAFVVRGGASFQMQVFQEFHSLDTTRDALIMEGTTSVKTRSKIEHRKCKISNFGT